MFNKIILRGIQSLKFNGSTINTFNKISIRAFSKINKSINKT